MKLSTILNARGSYTPLGVSRSEPGVADACAAGLQRFVLMEELFALVDRQLSGSMGSEAGTVVHCTASAITLSIAACMTGCDLQKVAALPTVAGIPHKVLIPVAHVVEYGQPILQAVRLSGATPIVVGTSDVWDLAPIEQALQCGGFACVLLVESRLVSVLECPVSDVVALAHRYRVPVVVDAAAQYLRLGELMATGADLVLASGQKYLASPTAGLVLGRRELVDAVRAQERGIGRGMKATKEAMLGVLAALEAHEALDLERWSGVQGSKLARFISAVNDIPGATAEAVADPTGLPFARARLKVADLPSGLDATALVSALRNGDPSIWCFDNQSHLGLLEFELVPLTDCEIDLLIVRLAAWFGDQAARSSL